jgi:uncharacterized protein (TIGR02145 family)
MKLTRFLFYFLFATTLIFISCGDDNDDSSTCSDGIQNGTETGVDCGGASCLACVVTCPTTVSDIDGNEYNVVKIGNQCWMQENLKTSKYNDGTSIPTGLSDVAWEATTNGAFAIYDNVVDNNTTYGKLYNWFAVNTGKLCPDGWHIPSDEEWIELTDFLGGEAVAGGKMKSTSSWELPNTDASNSSGFSGLPGGNRYFDGSYNSIGLSGQHWSSTETDANIARILYLYHDSGIVGRGSRGKKDGTSCRCVKD